MEIILAFVALIILCVLFGGGICGIAALVLFSKLRSSMAKLQVEVNRLKQSSPGGMATAGTTQKPASRAPTPTPASQAPTAQTVQKVQAPRAESPPPLPASVTPDQAFTPQPEEREKAGHAAKAGSPPPTPPPPPSGPSFPSFPLPKRVSWEEFVGVKGLAWVAALLILIGSGLFLKYAYDNEWIGPGGRIAIAAFAATACLLGGEYLRRRNFEIMFQTLTGIAIALYYGCIFFSFQVYHLVDPTPAFGLAIFVTMAAIALAVAHDSIAIALIALIGGFLSPVLVSTGENHPYILFTYVTILDLVALGAAYFRRWRGVEIAAFAGSFLLFAGWFIQFYEPDTQLMPGTLYLSIFYLLFLIIPNLHSLVWRIQRQAEGILLVGGNTAVSLLFFYLMLYTDYRSILGFVVLGQAILVFTLFQLWLRRVGKPTAVGESLLIIALGLVTLAVPLQLRLYGIPIAWAIEGALFVYLGIRFEKIVCRIGGVAAIVLAGCGLLYRLPLHKAAFLPVINIPFGAWVIVILAAAGAAYLLSVTKTRQFKVEKGLFIAPFLQAYVLLCLLLTLEIFAYWDFTEYRYSDSYLWDSLVVLWAVIPLATAFVVLRSKQKLLMPLAFAAYVAGGLFMLTSFGAYDDNFPVLLLNVTYLSRLLFVISVLVAAAWLRNVGIPYAMSAAAVVGNLFLAVLNACELLRWSDNVAFLSEDMAIGAISAAWAAHALILIWLGLVLRNNARRWLGLALFAIAVAKTLVYDTAELAEVYRIVSCIGSGVLLLPGAYFYKKYSERILGTDQPAEQPQPLPETPNETT